MLKTTKLYVAGWVIDGDAIDWMNSDVLTDINYLIISL